MDVWKKRLHATFQSSNLPISSFQLWIFGKNLVFFSFLEAVYDIFCILCTKSALKNGLLIFLSSYCKALIIKVLLVLYHENAR